MDASVVLVLGGAVLAYPGVSRLGRRMFGDGETATGHPEFDRRFRDGDSPRQTRSRPSLLRCSGWPSSSAADQ